MFDAEYENLKASLMSLGPVVPGRLREVYLRCGKKNCRCWTDKKDWHGPYVFWDRTDGKRLASRSVNMDHAKILRCWIRNRKEFERIVRAIYKRGLWMADRLKKSE
jgi:hypothetical protein